MKSASRLLLVILLLMPVMATANSEWSARLQLQAANTKPDDNNPITGGETHLHDRAGEMRAMFHHREGALKVGVHYQLIHLQGDSLRALNNVGAPASPLSLSNSGLQNDRLRFFDLDHELSDGDDNRSLHRLDRFYLQYTQADYSLVAGRFAVSWGNGLVYNPVDIFNPFDPAAIDTEYKSGDDMIYGQNLFSDGSDLQVLVVARRDASDNNVSRQQSSLAMKWHGLHQQTDIDIYLARHYSDNLIGAGFASDVEGLLWRGDLLLTHTTSGHFSQWVSSLSYAWTWNSKPINASVEIHGNSLGLDYDGGYDVTQFTNNIALQQRLLRGETAILGRRYLATVLDVELHPLLRFQPTVLLNLVDHSSLWQLLFNADLQQNLLFRAGLRLTSGETGSEYGDCPATPSPCLPNNGTSLFVQLNLYL